MVGGPSRYEFDNASNHKLAEMKNIVKKRSRFDKSHKTKMYATTSLGTRAINRRGQRTYLLMGNIPFSGASQPLDFFLNIKQLKHVLVKATKAD